MKFEDRISEYPGRIKLTEENGEAHYYTLERADEPTQPGTPLSAENLNKLTQDVNGKTGASIVLTGDDIAISASDNTTVKERVDSVQSAASEAQSTASAAQSTADTAVSKANTAQSTANSAMPKSGGNFTGAIAVPNSNNAGYFVRNIWCGDAYEREVNTSYIWTKRK